MGSPVKRSISAGTLGFSFIMRPNGTGGTFPKTYAVNAIANRLMAGQVSEFAANPPFPSLWPSDPGDNVFPITSRDYGVANGGVLNDNLCPNNIRLSQVPLSSVIASHGIGPGITQRNLPTSTNFGVVNLDTTPGAQDTIGNIGGIEKIRVGIVNPTTSNVLVNGGQLLQLLGLVMQDFRVSNLGNIQIVNLSAFEVTVGVVIQMSL